MMNKKGLLVRDVVISAVIFFGIIAIFILIVASMAVNYNRPEIVNDKFAQSYNKIYQLGQGNNGVSVSQNSITNVSGLQFQGNFDVAFSSMWVVLNLVWGTVDLYTGMGANMISDFTFLDAGVIKIVVYVLVTLLVVILIFNIISSVTRGRL